MDRLKFQTENFDPGDKQINELKAVFGHALGRGPSDATLCCCISKEKGKYVLNMRIHSSKGHFPIHHQHEDMDTLLKYTVSSMHDSFKEWRKDPAQFFKTHQMGEKPCFHGDGSIYKCPLGYYSNKKFEESAHIK